MYMIILQGVTPQFLSLCANPTMAPGEKRGLRYLQTLATLPLLFVSRLRNFISSDETRFYSFLRAVACGLCCIRFVYLTECS